MTQMTQQNFEPMATGTVSQVPTRVERSSAGRPLSTEIQTAMSKYFDKFFYAFIELLRRSRFQREVKVSDSRMNSRLMANSEGLSTPALIAIDWRSSYACGHPRMDAQHQELFEIGNRLIDAVLKCKSRAHIEFLLDELTLRIRDHFVEEEAVMARTKFPLSAQHCAQHTAMLEKADALREGYSTGQLTENAVVGFIVYDVISKHILHEDVKFALKSLVAGAA